MQCTMVYALKRIITNDGRDFIFVKKYFVHVQNYATNECNFNEELTLIKELIRNDQRCRTIYVIK